MAPIADQPDAHGGVVPTADLHFFEARVRAIVVEHLAILLQERLFVIATDPVGTAAPIAQEAEASTARPHEGPTVLALDASGRQVIVDVAGVLDQSTLVRVLSMAGEAVGRTRTEIARLYAAGPARFDTDLAAFIDEAAVGESAPGAAHLGGARIVLVCGEVTTSVRGALRFLRQGGGLVEVLPLSQQTVERVIADLNARRARAAQIHPSRTSETSPPDTSLSETSPPDTSLSETSLSETSADLAPPRQEAAASPTAPTAPASSPTPEPTEASKTPEPPKTPEPRLTLTRRAEPLTATSQIPLRPLAQVTPNPQVDSLPRARPLPRMVLPRQSPADAEGGVRPAAQPLAQRSAALQAAVTGIPVGQFADNPEDQPIFRDLRLLGAELDEPVTVVWSRERRGERYEAVLYPTGVIELPGGAKFRSPSLAAVTVSGSMAHVDGWAAWRFGDNGPTLAEAWIEIFGSGEGK